MSGTGAISVVLACTDGIVLFGHPTVRGSVVSLSFGFTHPPEDKGSHDASSPPCLGLFFIAQDLYDVREMIGHGTSGEVRRAINRKTGKQVAVKVTPPSHTHGKASAVRAARLSFRFGLALAGGVGGGILVLAADVFGSGDIVVVAVCGGVVFMVVLLSQWLLVLVGFNVGVGVITIDAGSRWSRL